MFTGLILILAGLTVAEPMAILSATSETQDITQVDWIWTAGILGQVSFGLYIYSI